VLDDWIRRDSIIIIVFEMFRITIRLIIVVLTGTTEIS
jgi:hypothetical protein